MDELRRQGDSRAAVALMETPDYWRATPLWVLRIVLADKAEDMDAFTAKLVGIILGTRIAEGLPQYVTLYSNCKAAIARRVVEAITPGAYAIGHLRNGPMFGVLRHHSSAVKGLIHSGAANETL
jgi:hypothetical protein